MSTGVRVAAGTTSLHRLGLFIFCRDVYVRHIVVCFAVVSPKHYSAVFSGGLGQCAQSASGFKWLPFLLKYFLEISFPLAYPKCCPMYCSVEMDLFNISAMAGENPGFVPAGHALYLPLSWDSRPPLLSQS